MSKELEALDRLIAVGDPSKYWNSNYFVEDVDIVKQALQKAQEQEKVFEIIKEKKVELFTLHYSVDIDNYNSHWNNKMYYLTEEEFELLKRWLENA